jgi:hypothetical protein
MSPFFDTGVALKLVVPEPLSGEVLSFVKRRKVPILVSRLIELEMETALNAMAFREHITRAQLATAKNLLKELTKEGKFLPVGLSLDEIAAESLRLSTAITLKTGCRTLDLMHIAAARLLGCKEFVSTDRRQLTAAKLAGLKPHDLSKP